MFTFGTKDCNEPIKVKGPNDLTTEGVNKMLNIKNGDNVHITNKVQIINTELKPNLIIR